MPDQDKMGFLRRTSRISSLFCFVSAVICVLILLIFFGDLSKVYKASFASSSFFFFTSGFVLKEMADTKVARTDLPGPAPGAE